MNGLWGRDRGEGGWFRTGDFGTRTRTRTSCPFLKSIAYGANGYRLEAYATLRRGVFAIGPREAVIAWPRVIA
jgi:hypothetical protein